MLRSIALVGALCVIAFAHSSAAQESKALVVGDTFFNRCARPDNFDSALCMGYLIGMSDSAMRLRLIGSGDPRYCFKPPQQTSYQQWYDIFIAYLRANPALRHHHTVDLYMAALAEAFPCSAPSSPSQRR